MKKHLAIYSIILALMFGALSIWDRGSDYLVEKQVWKIYQDQVDIAKDPKSVPDNVYKRVVKEYQAVIEKFPDSPLLPELYIKLGETYALWRKYDEARGLFGSLKDRFPDNRELIAEAAFNVGETYEAEGNWPQAEAVYQNVIRDFPLTDVGLRTPIYIANHYRDLNDFQATMTAYEAAIARYKKLAEQYRDTKIGLAAARHLSTCYLDQSRWQEAIEVLGGILEGYTTTQNMSVQDTDMVIKTINIVSAYKIADYNAAVVLYEGILERNPNHPLRKYLLKVIDAFHQLEAQGVKVSEQ